MDTKYDSFFPSPRHGRMSAFLALLLLLTPATGIHGATITAASASYADVSTAVAQAHDGDTVTVPAGTQTWSSTLTINKAITLQGAGKTQTIITNSSNVNNGSLATSLIILDDGGNNSLSRRVTGFGFKAFRAGTGQFDRVGRGVACLGFLSNKRIDHCRFDDFYAHVTVGNAIGVADHNEFYNGGYTWRHMANGNAQQYAWDNFRPVGAVGGDMAHDALTYFFYEDNYAEVSGQSSLISEDNCTSYVVRHCTIILREAHGSYTAADSFNLMECHGDNPSVGEYSTLATLVYENDIQMNNGAAMAFFQQRGGTGVFFNNRVVTSGTGIGTASVELREDTVPGEDGAGYVWPSGQLQYTDKVHRTYIYNNTYNGAVQGPRIRNLSQTVLSIGASPAACPTCSAWTTAESPLLLPPYPHPLVSGSPTPTPTPVPTVTPTPSPLPGLSFNSNAGNIVAPFTVNADNSISQSVETSDPTLGGKATYTFAVIDAGNYTMLAIVSCPDSGSNSFFVDIDSDPVSTMVWQVDVTSGFESRTITWSGVTTPRFWALSAGVHQLVIRGREAGAKIKSITLVKQPATPTAPQVVPGGG